MRASTLFTIFLGAASSMALAQTTSQSPPRDPQNGGVHSTDTGNAGTATSTTDTTGIISGQVVRYEPGRSIVVRDANNRERTFSLGAGVTVPVDVHVGSYVNLSTETNGTNVTRVTSSGMTSGSSSLPNTGTTSGTGTSNWGSSGSSAQPTQRNQDYTSSGSQSSGSGSTSGSQLPRTGNTTGSSASAGAGWVSGTVTAYTPGQSMTITMPGGTLVEYKLDSSSDVPSDMAIGKTVRIQSDKGSEGSQRVVRHVTYSTTTKTTIEHKKSSTP